MKKELKMTETTKNKLKEIANREKSIYMEDAKDALKKKEELTGQIAIKRYNQWQRS